MRARLAISDDDRELPFEFGEPVELNIESVGDHESVREIEAGLPRRVEDDMLHLT